MDIGDVAKASRVPTSTLRFYEEKGLIKPLGRKGLRRYYAPEVLQTLALITLGRNVGLSLDEIGNMLLPDGFEINRAQLLVKAEELDKRIAEMTAMRDGLRHAAVCSAPSHLECPTFMRYVNLAGKRWSIPKTKFTSM